MIELEWRRTKQDGGLELWVHENDIWVHYRRSNLYVPDAKLSSNSGFATAQKYLKIGATYLPMGSYEEQVRPHEVF